MVEAPTSGATRSTWIKALNGPLLAQYNEQLVKARGIPCIRRGVLRHRHVTTSSKAVNTLADMKGLKAARAGERRVRRWPRAGRAPDADELQRALPRPQAGRGRWSGEPASTIKSGKFNEVQKYLVSPATS